MELDFKQAGLQRGTMVGINDRALWFCARAKELEEAGDYEEARASLSDFWRHIGERPDVTGLDRVARASLLLRAGALTGWIGSARQITGAQEIAKDLISEAARLFEQSRLSERMAEARVDLAICYWREGAFDEARVSLDEALRQLGDIESEQRLRVFLNRAIVDKVSHRYDDALKTHREAAPLFQASNNNTLRGKFHNEYASVLKNLGLAQRRSDYIDQALVEYSAASFYAEQAGNKRIHGGVENNVALLLIRLGRIADAQQHLERARALFTALKDKGMVAQVNDTRARAFIAQGRFAKAEMLARGSVKVLEAGDELSLLAEALTTQGTAFARLGNFAQSCATLEKAIRTAHTAGDPESGGVAALTMVEELTTYLPFSELVTYYRLAESQLANSQREEIESRLDKCARRLLVSESALNPDGAGSNGTKTSPASAEDATQPDLAGGTLDEQVLRYEGGLIKQALISSGGRVTRAARKLGITHQGLAFILNGRHRDLLAARKPVKRRRRSIIRFH